MRKPIIAGNWKMYQVSEQIEQFMSQLEGKVPSSEKVESVICAPSIYVRELVKRANGTDLHIGAQTMHYEKEGAFTGEISPAQLQDSGVTHVIIGHSERRQYFNETDETVNEKVKAAFEYDVTPIVCVGETLDEREANETMNKINAQVERAFKSIPAYQVKRAVIAYEPIWAIGTGKTATSEQANEVCAAIRQKVSELFDGETAEAIRIQYGGSVKPENIDELLSMSDIDGALVGGASLKAESFLALLEAGAK